MLLKNFLNVILAFTIAFPATIWASVLPTQVTEMQRDPLAWELLQIAQEPNPNFAIARIVKLKKNLQDHPEIFERNVNNLKNPEKQAYRAKIDGFLDQAQRKLQSHANTSTVSGTLSDQVIDDPEIRQALQTLGEAKFDNSTPGTINTSIQTLTSGTGVAPVPAQLNPNQVGIVEALKKQHRINDFVTEIKIKREQCGFCSNDEIANAFIQDAIIKSTVLTAGTSAPSMFLPPVWTTALTAGGLAAAGGAFTLTNLNLMLTLASIYDYRIMDADTDFLFASLTVLGQAGISLGSQAVFNGLLQKASIAHSNTVYSKNLQSYNQFKRYFATRAARGLFNKNLDPDDFRSKSKSKQTPTRRRSLGHGGSSRGDFGFDFLPPGTTGAPQSPGSVTPGSLSPPSANVPAPPTVGGQPTSPTGPPGGIAIDPATGQPISVDPNAGQPKTSWAIILAEYVIGIVATPILTWSLGNISKNFFKWSQENIRQKTNDDFRKFLMGPKGESVMKLLVLSMKAETDPKAAKSVFDLANTTNPQVQFILNMNRSAKVCSPSDYGVWMKLAKTHAVPQKGESAQINMLRYACTGSDGKDPRFERLAKEFITFNEIPTEYMALMKTARLETRMRIAELLLQFQCLQSGSRCQRDELQLKQFAKVMKDYLDLTTGDNGNENLAYIDRLETFIIDHGGMKPSNYSPTGFTIGDTSVASPYNMGIGYTPIAAPPSPRNDPAANQFAKPNAPTVAPGAIGSSATVGGVTLPTTTGTAPGSSKPGVTAPTTAPANPLDPTAGLPTTGGSSKPAGQNPF